MSTLLLREALLEKHGARVSRAAVGNLFQILFSIPFLAFLRMASPAPILLRHRDSWRSWRGLSRNRRRGDRAVKARSWLALP